MSSRDREARLDELFERLRSLPKDEHDAFLASACADDPALAAEARALFAGEPPTGFLEPPAPRRSVARHFGVQLEGEELGAFRLVREIGRGAMGVVYLAEERHTGRKVAAKVLPPASASIPELAARFKREVQAASRLQHAHAVPILAYGEERDVLWYAMSFVEGHDLHEELERLRKQHDGKPAPTPILPAFDDPAYVGVVVERIAELVDAIEAAHAIGLVHRDVKPQNVLLDADGRFHLADFGLVLDARLAALTEPGRVQGTPHYMSPEQARVVQARIDHRTDVYSISVVLYELLGLKRAVRGETQEEAFEEITRRDPAPLRRVNPRIARDLEVICAKGMSKRPRDRYRTAAELADDLRRFLRHEAIRARPPSMLERARRFGVAHRSHIGAGLVLVVASSLGWQAARSMSRSQELEGDKQMLEAVLRIPDWSTSDQGRIAELVRARGRMRELLEDGEPHSRSLDDVLHALEARFARDKSERTKRGEELIAQGRGGDELHLVDEPAASEANPLRHARVVTGASDRELQAGLRALKDAATLYWDDPIVVEAYDLARAWPRVAVRLDPRTVRDAVAAGADLTGAHAFLRPIDSVAETIGAPIELGPLPIDAVAVEPGVYRIVVEVPGYGFSEHMRVLSVRPEPYAIDARVRPTAEIVRDLHRIESGRFRYRHRGIYATERGGLGCSEVHAEVDVDAFWIAPALASNGEVMAFLRETKHAAPIHWWSLGFRGDPSEMMSAEKLDAWLELPAVGFDWTFARDYAEWAGLRLPEHAELERALRGKDALYYPWGDDLPVPPDVRVNLGAASQSSSSLVRERFELYLAHARPVRDPAYLHAPEGLFHALGNVRQWTESLLTEMHEGRIEADPYSRIVLGSAWWQPLDTTTLCAHKPQGSDERYPALDIGIRCAKSFAP